MKVSTAFIMLMLCAWLAGCASAPPDAAAEYLLRPPLKEAGPTPAQQPPDIALGRVSIPPYLDREGIVVETGDNRVQAARGHRWAEPLSRSVRRMLQVGVSRALGRPVAGSADGAAGPEVLIDVDMHQLHGSLEGRVRLAADWQLRDPRTGRVLARHELVRTTLTEAAGYDALVRAHAELLMQLSRAIAQSLGSL